MLMHVKMMLGAIHIGQDRLFDINLFSVFQLIQMTLPHLRETKGSIVMVSSGAANIYIKGWDAYGS